MVFKIASGKPAQKSQKQSARIELVEAAQRHLGALEALPRHTLAEAVRRIGRHGTAVEALDRWRPGVGDEAIERWRRDDQQGVGVAALLRTVEGHLDPAQAEIFWAGLPARWQQAEDDARDQERFRWAALEAERMAEQVRQQRERDALERRKVAALEQVVAQGAQAQQVNAIQEQQPAGDEVKINPGGKPARIREWHATTQLFERIKGGAEWSPTTHADLFFENGHPKFSIVVALKGLDAALPSMDDDLALKAGEVLGLHRDTQRKWLQTCYPGVEWYRQRVGDEGHLVEQIKEAYLNGLDGDDVMAVQPGVDMLDTRRTG